MNNMTITYPVEYITLNGVKYKVTPLKSEKQIQLVNDFKNFLDGLPAEIYNASIDVYGQYYSLKDFSDMIETELLVKEDELLTNILNFKIIVKDVIEEYINNYYHLLEGVQVEADHSFPYMLEKTMQAVEQCIKYAEENNLTDTQDFINWEDDLNMYSCKEH